MQTILLNLQDFVVSINGGNSIFFNLGLSIKEKKEGEKFLSKILHSFVHSQQPIKVQFRILYLYFLESSKLFAKNDPQLTGLVKTLKEL